MVFSYLDVEELIALEVEFFSAFEELAVELHRDQRDEPCASFNHTSVAFVSQLRRANILG